MVEDSRDSILAMLSGVIAPIFAPLGFGDWRVSTALLTGFIAKESVVSTLTVLLGGSAVTELLSIGAVVPLLVFCLLYTPCAAAVASVKQELGRKWAVGVVVLQCAVAWICALVLRLVLLLFGVV
jgi:ferrous iron transport protein B